MESSDKHLYNADIAPVPSEKRQWSALNIASLWVAMVVCIPTYLLAGGMMAQGMSWKMAISVIIIGNLIVLVPMVLNGAPGTKYGIPFPVLLRSSFGILGSNIAGFLRIIIACGWFGIQTWIGGNAIYIILCKFYPSAKAISDLPILGINIMEFSCFMIFWAINIAIILMGINTLKWFENMAAPLLILLSIALVIWAYQKAGGFGDVLKIKSNFSTKKDYILAFIAGVTANVGFWATLSLNISDFTRYVKKQKDQVIGQFIGLPITMAFFALISIFVTGATTIIYGKKITDPVLLVGNMDSTSIVVISLFFLIIATLSTNIAANIVPSAFYFSNLLPKKVSFKLGGIIAGIIGIIVMPWKLMDAMIPFLVSYSALVGPIAGIMICDYYLIKKKNLVVEDLFKTNGKYTYTNGFNLSAFLALIIGILPNIPGFLSNLKIINLNKDSIWQSLFNFAWFNGFFIAFITYYILNKLKTKK